MESVLDGDWDTAYQRAAIGEGDRHSSRESKRNVPFLPCMEPEVTAVAFEHDDIDCDAGGGRARLFGGDEKRRK
jgi:hypothetical protein